MWGQADPADLRQSWAVALGAFGADDLREALEAAHSAYREYPPTLPQFVDLCRDAKARRVASVKRISGPREPMPEKARQAFAAFRRGHVRSS